MAACRLSASLCFNPDRSQAWDGRSCRSLPRSCGIDKASLSKELQMLLDSLVPQVFLQDTSLEITYSSNSSEQNTYPHPLLLSQVDGVSYRWSCQVSVLFISSRLTGLKMTLCVYQSPIFHLVTPALTSSTTYWKSHCNWLVFISTNPLTFENEQLSEHFLFHFWISTLTIKFILKCIVYLDGRKISRSFRSESCNCFHMCLSWPVYHSLDEGPPASWWQWPQAEAHKLCRIRDFSSWNTSL